MLSQDEIGIISTRLESAYDQGDLAAAAIGAWMLSAYRPEDSRWRLYAKHILRETGAAQASARQIASAVDDAFERKQALEAFGVLSMGLLANPAEPGLLRKMIQLAGVLDRTDLADAALLLMPDEVDDPALLNMRAAKAHEAGRYEESARIFGRLVEKYPDSDDLKVNLSAALVGLGRHEEAITLLESVLLTTEDKKEALFRLMPLYRRRGTPAFESLTHLNDVVIPDMSSASAANVKARIYAYLDSPEQAIDAYQCALDFTDDPKTRFDLSLLQLRVGDYEEGFDNYRHRFACFASNRWLEPGGERYDGRMLDNETLLVWAEQGVGDEVFFAYPLACLRSRATRVTLAVDARLVRCFKTRFPDWEIISRDQASALIGSDPARFDFEIPMGELLPLFLGELRQLPPSELHPLFEPLASRLEEIEASFSGPRPRVAISWRGGTDLDGKARSMALEDLVAAVPAEAVVDIVSVQYSGDVDREIRELGDPRVRNSGLDNRNDLEGVMALLRNADAVISVDNAVVHFAAAVGTPCHVIIPQALSQFRFKNPVFREACFPQTTLYYQSLDGDWTSPAAEAWRAVLMEAHSGGEHA